MKKVLNSVIAGIVLFGTLVTFSGCGDTKKQKSGESNNENNVDNMNNKFGAIYTVGEDVKQRYEYEKNSEPVYDKDGNIFMAVEDVTRPGIAAIGVIQSGTIRLGDEVQIVGVGDKVKNAEVEAIEELEEGNNNTRIKLKSNSDNQSYDLGLNSMQVEPTFESPLEYAEAGKRVRVVLKRNTKRRY